MPLSKRRVGLRPRGAAAKASRRTTTTTATRFNRVNVDGINERGCCHYVLLAVFAVVALVTAGSYAKDNNAQWFSTDAASGVSRLGGSGYSAHSENEPKAEAQSSILDSAADVSVDVSHLPAQCTPEEMNELAAQLPSTHCGEAGHRQSCSITKATVRAVCLPTVLFRRPGYIHLCLSLFVEYSPTDTTLNSVLRVGSHDRDKYPQGCWPDNLPVLNSHRDVTAAALTTREDTSTLRKIVPDEKVLSIYSKGTYLQDNRMLQDSTHFMRVSSRGIQDGNDYHILMGALETLKRVRMLEFQTNFRGAFGPKARKPVFDALRNKAGMVCYWYGGKPGIMPNLWRSMV